MEPKTIRTTCIVMLVIIAVFFIAVAISSAQAPATIAKAETKAITLTQPEKQPFIDILNHLELTLTQKQAAETATALAQARIELDQRNFKDAVDALKKARGCEGCTFDANKLELVPPIEVKEVPKLKTVPAN